MSETGETEFNFEVFDKRSTPLVKRPEVTIQSSGSMSFNKSAFHALGEPEAVELLYDREQRVIGFRPVDANETRAYPIRGVGKSPTTFIVAGRAFLGYYDIPFGNPVRREAKVVGSNTLVIDLKDPGRDATSNRNRQKLKDAVPATVAVAGSNSGHAASASDDRSDGAPSEGGTVAS